MSHWFYITPEEYAQAEANGISEILLNVRIRQLGWTKERALADPPHNKKSLKGEWLTISEGNGICYSTFRYRVNRLGWSMERAATQPLQDRREQAASAKEGRRKYPAHLLELAKKNGINVRTFHRRMKIGWDGITAASRKPMTPTEIGLMTKEKRTSYFKHLKRQA